MLLQPGQPAVADVDRGVDVAVVLRAAARALPVPNGQALAAGGAGPGAAGAAVLGGVALVDRLEPHACVIALVLQHGPKRAPPRVQHGLGHAGLGERARIDVTHEDRLARTNQRGREFVQVVFPAVGCLGVNRLDASLVARALGQGQRRLQVAVELLGLDLLPVGAAEQVLEPQVQSDGLLPDDREVARLGPRLHLDGHVQVYQRPRASSLRLPAPSL